VFEDKRLNDLKYGGAEFISPIKCRVLINTNIIGESLGRKNASFKTKLLLEGCLVLKGFCLLNSSEEFATPARC